MDKFVNTEKLVNVLNYLGYQVVCIFHSFFPEEREYFIIYGGQFNYSQNNVDFHEVEGKIIDQAMIADFLNLNVQDIQVKRGVIESRLSRLDRVKRKYSKDYSWVLYEDYISSTI